MYRCSKHNFKDGTSRKSAHAIASTKKLLLYLYVKRPSHYKSKKEMAEFLRVLSGLFDRVSHRREVWCGVQARSFRLRLRKNSFQF